MLFASVPEYDCGRIDPRSRMLTAADPALPDQTCTYNTM